METLLKKKRFVRMNTLTIWLTKLTKEQDLMRRLRVSMMTSRMLSMDLLALMVSHGAPNARHAIQREW
jgi:hypothetical protein